MKFTVEHRFDAPREAVATLLTDPEFEQSVELPDLSRPEIVEHHVDGTEITLRLRYEFVGHLDPIAKRLLAGRRLTWLQELRLDTTSFRGRLSFSAEADPDRLHGRAALALRADGEAASVRSLDGDFVVRVPVVGGTAERRILPGVLRRLDVEADAVRARLQR